MDRSTQSWFSIVGVLGAMFSLLTLAVGDDFRDMDATPRGAATSTLAAAAPITLPTILVLADPAELAAADAMDAAERAALTVAMVPAPIREAKAQLQKATAASRRASRVSLRLPYYAFGPDPLGGSK